MRVTLILIDQNIFNDIIHIIDISALSFLSSMKKYRDILFCFVLVYFINYAITVFPFSPLISSLPCTL